MPSDEPSPATIPPPYDFRSALADHDQTVSDVQLFDDDGSGFEAHVVHKFRDRGQLPLAQSAEQWNRVQHRDGFGLRYVCHGLYLHRAASTMSGPSGMAQAPQYLAIRAEVGIEFNGPPIADG